MRIITFIGLGLFLSSGLRAGLHTDVSINWIEGVKRHLEHHSLKINYKDTTLATSRESGATPLWIATVLGFEDMVKLLIEKGADLSIPSEDFGSTPLIEACRRGHESIALLLIEKGSALDTADRYKDTALIQCANKQLVRAVNKLIEHGADANACNQVGQNALMWASKRDDAEIFSLLLPVTSNVFTQDSDGRTALDYASDKLREIASQRAKIDRIILDADELKRYMAPSELKKFLLDLLSQDAPNQ